MRLKSLFRTKTLRTRLILWFLLISLLPLGWMTFISYEFSKKMLLNQATQHLQTLSLRQAELIENYFREREKGIIALAKGLIVPEVTRELGAALANFGQESVEYQRIRDKFYTRLTLISEAQGYYNLFLVDKYGNVIFSILPSSTAIGANLVSTHHTYSILKDLFESSKNFLEISTSNFAYYSPQELPADFVAAPILDPEFIGVIIVQIDNSAIYKLLTDYSGLGQTGETILVTEVDHQLLSIAPLRYEQNKDPMQVIPPSTPFSEFVLEVLRGERAVDTITDYRGQETLMVGRYFLPVLNWAIITKMDTKELLAPINKLQLLSLMMGLTIAAIVALTASSVARAIAYPILMLTRKTKLITAGDLSQRIQIDSDDEFGRLGKSFNDMANQLDNIVKNLDHIVTKRTEEVKRQNVRLEHTIEELQQAQDRLVNQEKLASLGALTAGIAHEIKNPLNFITNFAELTLQISQDLQELLDKIKDRLSPTEIEEQHELLETLKLNVSKIYEHGKRADSIVRNMLQHSRGAPGEKAAVDLNILLDEYVALSYHGMRAQDSSFNVKIEKNYDPSLPKIHVVPQEMSRVFLNLLNNAYYSVMQKKREATDTYNPVVRITTQSAGDYAIIKIWDNGKGISNETFPKLFTPFFTTKPPGEGTGLGLSLSYNIIVQGHNGTLIADSEPGEFAEFVINLPLRSKQH